MKCVFCNTLMTDFLSENNEHIYLCKKCSAIYTTLFNQYSMYENKVINDFLIPFGVELPTKTQEAQIKIIEEELKTKFQGITYDNARDFISQYYEKSRQIRNSKKATQKQINFIKTIANELIIYVDTDKLTFGEAHNWISLYKDLYETYSNKYIEGCKEFKPIVDKNFEKCLIEFLLEIDMNLDNLMGISSTYLYNTVLLRSFLYNNPCDIFSEEGRKNAKNALTTLKEKYIAR